jgi:hypothetical protein
VQHRPQTRRASCGAASARKNGDQHDEVSCAERTAQPDTGILWHEHAGACGKHRSPRPRLAPHSPSASTRGRQSTLARRQPRAIKKTRDVARALTTPAAPFARRSPPRLHETNTLDSQPQPLLPLLLLPAWPWVRAAALHRDVIQLLFSRHDAGRGRSQVCLPYASAEFALDHAQNCCKSVTHRAA